MKEHISLPAGLVQQVEQAAARAGESTEVHANRLFARGAMAILGDLLGPLLDDPTFDAETAPALDAAPENLTLSKVDAIVPRHDLDHEDVSGAADS